MRIFTAIVVYLSISVVIAQKKEPAVVGKGPYIAVQAGGGLLLGNVDGKVYKYAKQAGFYQYQESGDTGFARILPGLQFIWGYTHRWGNFTLGVEAALISPALRMGYVFLDRHQISVSGHFAPLGYGATWAGVKYASLKVKADPNVSIEYEDEKIRVALPVGGEGEVSTRVPKKVTVDPELDLDTVDPQLSAASGWGFSLIYEYFGKSKLFFRSELRCDYYGVMGVTMVDSTLRTDKVPVFLNPFNGDLSMWDVSLYLGMGAQW